jgi:hypothetical protein
MQAAVGRVLSRRVSFPIAASDIRRWAIACYYPEDPPRLYWDATFAATTIYGGIVAPPEMNPFAWIAAEQHGLSHKGSWNLDRIENSIGIEGPGLAFSLNGGLEVQYGVRMRIDDVIASVTRLGDYRERQGRLGLMLLTILEDTWTNQREEVVKIERGTQIRYSGRKT